MRRALLAIAIGIAGLTGCGGGGGDAGESAATEVRGPAPAPVIEAAVLDGEHVKVAYRIPDSGDNDPLQMLLSVDDSDDNLGPLTEEISPVSSEGERTMEFEVEPNRDEILASVIYADGSRSDVIHFPLQKP